MSDYEIERMRIMRQAAEVLGRRIPFSVMREIEAHGSSMSEVASEGEDQYHEWFSEQIDAVCDLGVPVPDELTALSDLSELVDMAIASSMTSPESIAALKRLRDGWSS